jgi:hypothetical protein
MACPTKPNARNAQAACRSYNANGLVCFKYDDGTYACNFGYHFAEKTFGGSHEDC